MNEEDYGAWLESLPKPVRDSLDEFQNLKQEVDKLKEELELAQRKSEVRATQIAAVKLASLLDLKAITSEDGMIVLYPKTIEIWNVYSYFMSQISRLDIHYAVKE